MRLIQEITMPIKYLPFDIRDLAEKYKILINMPSPSGLVASLNFNFQYRM